MCFSPYAFKQRYDSYAYEDAQLQKLFIIL